MTLPSEQTLILLVGILLLSAPFISRVVMAYIASLNVPSKESKKEVDFEHHAVMQVLDLKNKLEREGATKASEVCKDLMMSVIYGDTPTRGGK